METSAFLWIQVCEQLKWHNKGNDTCIATLNRLWQKNVGARTAEGSAPFELPTLKAEMIIVHAEQWSLESLIAVPRGHTRARPLFFAPVIILHWFDRFFLLDGNTRVNFWLEQGNSGPHAVYRIAPRDI